MLTILQRLFAGGTAQPLGDPGHSSAEGFCPLDHLERGLDTKLAELEGIRKDLYSLKGRILRAAAAEEKSPVFEPQKTVVEEKKSEQKPLSNVVEQIEKIIKDTKEKIQKDYEQLSQEVKSIHDELVSCNSAIAVTYPFLDSIYQIKLALTTERENKEFSKVTRREIVSLILKNLLQISDIFPRSSIENAHKKVFEEIHNEVKNIDNFLFEVMETLKKTRTNLSAAFPQNELEGSVSEKSVSTSPKLKVTQQDVSTQTEPSLATGRRNSF